MSSPTSVSRKSSPLKCHLSNLWWLLVHFNSTCFLLHSESLHWASFRVQGYRAYTGKAWETQGSTWNRKPSNTKRPLASWSHWGEMRTATVFIKINEQIEPHHIKPTQKSKYRQHLWSARRTGSHDEVFPVYKQGLCPPPRVFPSPRTVILIGQSIFWLWALSLSKYLP